MKNYELIQELLELPAGYEIRMQIIEEGEAINREVRDYGCDDERKVIILMN